MLDSTPQTPREPLAALTRREEQVLAMTARGLTNQQMAEGLSISIHAIKFHLATIYRKLHVANRTEATFLYLSNAAESQTSNGLGAS